MGSVLLTEPAEFLAEVDADRAEIDREIVRLTKQGSPAMSGTLTRVSVIAAYAVKGEVTRLRIIVGDLWGSAEPDQQVQDRATALFKELEGELLDRGLSVRSGVFE